MLLPCYDLDFQTDCKMTKDSIHTQLPSLRPVLLRRAGSDFNTRFGFRVSALNTAKRKRNEEVGKQKENRKKRTEKKSKCTSRCSLRGPSRPSRRIRGGLGRACHRSSCTAHSTCERMSKEPPPHTRKQTRESAFFSPLCPRNVSKGGRGRERESNLTSTPGSLLHIASAFFTVW